MNTLLYIEGSVTVLLQCTQRPNNYAKKCAKIYLISIVGSDFKNYFSPIFGIRNRYKYILLLTINQHFNTQQRN